MVSRPLASPPTKGSEVEKKPRILLLYVSAVSGHRQAAEAVKKALQEKFPQVVVRGENIFQHGNPLITGLLDNLYYAVIKLFPWLWDFLWDSRFVYWVTFPLRYLLYLLNYHRLYFNLLKPFSPHAVVCTHGLACALSAVAKKERNLNWLLFAVPTDFSLHPYWTYSGVNFYFLPSQECKKSLLERKVEENKLKVTGIPVFSFSKAVDKKSLRKKWGLDPDLFTILLMGGTRGIGPLKEMVKTLREVPFPLQIVVITGINRTLKGELEKLRKELEIPLKVFGFIKNIDEIMKLADFLLTKPGGLTCAEALANCLPLGIVDTIAGQERANKEFLLKKGVIFEIKNLENLVQVLKKLREGKWNKEGWERRAKEITHPDAARKIADKIIEMVREKWNI